VSTTTPSASAGAQSDAHRPALTPYAALLAQFGEPLMLWTCVHLHGAPAIQRTLPCPDAKLQTASQLAHALALHADQVDHHPSITLECGACTVVFQTHQPLGLTQQDAEGALWTQEIYQAFLLTYKEHSH
jgi:pterin-4a-carbinolamine dehydratase